MKRYVSLIEGVAARILNKDDDNMPRYFLHIHHKDCTIEDREGSEHADISSVQQEVIESARQIMASKILQGYLPTASTFSITDLTGAVVLVVPFLDAVEVD